MLAGLPIQLFDSEMLPSEPGDETLAILIELPSGKSIRLEEGDSIQIISFKLPREQVLICAYPDRGVEILDTVEPRIEPSPCESAWRYDLYGTIEKTDAKDSLGDKEWLYVLDVGEGTILVTRSLADLLPAAEPPLEVGDALRIPRAMLEPYYDGQLNV